MATTSDSFSTLDLVSQQQNIVRKLEMYEWVMSQFFILSIMPVSGLPTDHKAAAATVKEAARLLACRHPVLAMGIVKDDAMSSSSVVNTHSI